MSSSRNQLNVKPKNVKNYEMGRIRRVHIDERTTVYNPGTETQRIEVDGKEVKPRSYTQNTEAKDTPNDQVENQ